MVGWCVADVVGNHFEVPSWDIPTRFEKIPVQGELGLVLRRENVVLNASSLYIGAKHVREIEQANAFANILFADEGDVATPQYHTIITCCCCNSRQCLEQV
jgi:hypothetical protein